MRSREKEFPQAGFRINVQSFACFWMEMQTNKEQFENQKRKRNLRIPYSCLTWSKTSELINTYVETVLFMSATDFEIKFSDDTFPISLTDLIVWETRLLYRYF